MTLYEAIPNPDTPLVNQLVEGAWRCFAGPGRTFTWDWSCRAYSRRPACRRRWRIWVRRRERDRAGSATSIFQHSFASLLPLMDAFGIATAAEVDVGTLGERLRREAESTGRLLVLPSHVTAYARLPS